MTNFLLGAGVSVIGAAVVLGGGAFAMSKKARSLKNDDMAEFVTWKIERTLKDLDATEDQQEKIQAVVDDLMAEGMVLREAKVETKEAFKAELESDNPDAEKLHALIDERSADFEAFAHKALDSLLEVHETLTPEQRAELQKQIEARHSRRSKWHH